MIGDNENTRLIGQSDSCDGSLIQLYVINLFLKSTGHVNAGEMISSTDQICNFRGFKCDENRKFVEEINMNNLNLTGTLMSEIRFLKSLIKIDLNGNKLSGTIDESIFRDNLPNLKFINLCNNTFEGTVPEALLSHHQLIDLNISKNSFGGTLPSSFSYPQYLGKDL